MRKSRLPISCIIGGPVDTMISKACQRLGLMKHVLSIVPVRVRRTAYLTLCRPILEYASEVWDPHLVRQITSLEGVQRKAIRFILGVRGREGVTEARTFLEIELFELRRKNARVLKLLAGNSHTSLTYNFNHLQNIHSHETRLVKSGEPVCRAGKLRFLHS